MTDRLIYNSDSPGVNSDRLIEDADISTFLLGLVSAPLGAILVVLAPEFVVVILWPKWTAAILPFRILTAGIMLRNVYLMAYCLDGALGELRRRTVRDGIYALAVLIGSLIGARFGLVGVAKKGGGIANGVK